MAPDTLPDSRLRNADWGAVVCDWPLPGGGTARAECVPVFCGNCGAGGGFVPRDNTTFAFYLCQACFDAHGEIAGTLAVPDLEFREAVAHEMERLHGRALTLDEINALVEDGRLGRELELLARESPYTPYRG